MFGSDVEDLTAGRPFFGRMRWCRLQPPANCDECAGTGPSAVAVLVTYIVGVTTGAVVGWNLSKTRKDDSLSLQPIFRAGPPPAALADWSDPALRSLGRQDDVMSIQAPLIAFAF